MVSAYSIGKSQRSQSLHDTVRNPGPGTYQPKIEPLSNKNQSPRWSILGNRKGFITANHMGQTGPGQYDPKYEWKFDKQPCYKIGSCERAPLLLEQSVLVPGPGQYKLNQTLSGPKYSMAERTKDFKHPSGPGPQAYTLKSYITEDAKNIKIGSSKREGLATNNNFPGPGFYNTSHHFNLPSVKFGSEVRDPFGKLRSPSPGPGAYHATQTLTMKQYPAYKIGNEQRNYSSQNQKPGPGQYDPLYDQRIEKSPSYKIGSSEREPINNEHSARIPGPGNYTIYPSFHGPKYTMGARRKDHKQRMEEPRQVGSSTSRDPLSQFNEVPGPGYYDASKSHIYPSVKFGSEQRDPFGRFKQQSPGPGHYELKPMFADVPSYLLQK